MASRIQSIDILKGIGILFVLLGHLEIPSIVKCWIYGFHMPLFFFASGIFSYKKSFTEVFMKNCKCILIPWFFMFICYLIVFVSVGILHSKNIEDTLLNIANCFNLLDEDSLWYPTIWFLICLFVLKTLDSIVWIISSRSVVKVFAASVCYVIGQYIDMPFFIDTALSMYLFYEFGRIFHVLGFTQKKTHFSIPTIIILSYTVFIFYSMPLVDLKHNIYPVYLPLLAIPMIWALFQISLMIHESADQKLIKPFDRLGRSSLVLFGLHQPLWLILFPLSSHISYQMFRPIFMLVLTFPLILKIEDYVSRVCPFLLGKQVKSL